MRVKISFRDGFDTHFIWRRVGNPGDPVKETLSGLYLGCKFGGKTVLRKVRAGGVRKHGPPGKARILYPLRWILT